MNRQPPSSARLLSTAARVHPPYLPYLHNASRSRSKGLKWIPPLAAVATAGYAVASYRETASAQSQAQTAAYEAERRAREALMADAYGERGSLAELERAVRVYEAHAQTAQAQSQGTSGKP